MPEPTTSTPVPHRPSRLTNQLILALLAGAVMVSLWIFAPDLLHLIH